METLELIRQREDPEYYEDTIEYQREQEAKEIMKTDRVFEDDEEEKSTLSHCFEENESKDSNYLT